MDLCAVDLVLAHLGALAESGVGGSCTAEHVVLNLLRVLAGMTDTTTANDQKFVAAATLTTEGVQLPDGDGGGAGHEVGVAPAPPPQYDGMEQSNGGGDDEEEDMIFGHEERNQFQEPTLFARVAAPYLCRALVTLESRNASVGAVFPEPILQGLARVLKNLSCKLVELQGLASATWYPGVYNGIVFSAVVAAAVFEFFSGRECNLFVSDGNDSSVGLVLSEELDRAKRACEEFEAALGGSEDVHQAVSRAVASALAAARPKST